MTTYSNLTSSYAILKSATIAALTDQGYSYNPLTTSFTEYLATALTGIGGSTVSNLSMSRSQLLAGIVNALGSGPVSHLTSSTSELLALLSGASTPPAPEDAPVMQFNVASNSQLLAILADF